MKHQVSATKTAAIVFVILVPEVVVELLARLAKKVNALLFEKTTMKKLKEIELYHIHRMKDKLNNVNEHSNRWVVGNKLEFGSKKKSKFNLLHDRVFNPNINIDWEKNLIEKLSEKRINASTLKQRKEIENDFFQKGLIYPYSQFVRETVLEVVRKKLFAHKPSRLNGIWLTSKDNLKTWLQLIPQNQFPQKIFLVKFIGNLHKADGRWITNVNLYFDTIFKNAIGYWSGKLKSTNDRPQEEYIGNGLIEIIKEIK